MRELFLTLLDMSVTAGWVVLAVCLFRLIFRNAPKFLRCVLWGMAALRLVLPFSFESVFSLIPKTQPSSFIPQPISPVSASPELLEPLPEYDSASVFVVQSSPAVSAHTDIMKVLSCVWLAGCLLMLIYFVFSFVKLKRSLSEVVPADKNIFECSCETPFVLGLIHPKIYLPFSLTGAQREYVIAHEQAHIKRGDNWYKPIGFLLLSVYWFNPLMWAAYILLCKDIELACDERVVKDLSQSEKREYSKTLLSLSVSKKSVTACPVAFGENNVKTRVKNALSYKKPAFWVIIAAVIACVVLTVCFLTDPKDNKNEDAYVPVPVEEMDFPENLGPVWSSVRWDIDGDGKKEKCGLGMGPTSGLFTFTFYAEKENCDVFYLDIFLAEWGQPSFVKGARGNKLYVRLEGAVNGNDRRYYEINVIDGKIELSDADSALSHWGPSGAEAMAFLSGAFVENTQDGPVDLHDSDWGITLIAEDVTPIGMTLRLTQQGEGPGEGEFITEQYYRIDVYSDGEWKPLPDNGEFTTEEIVINPGGFYEWQLDWFRHCGYLENSYSAGLYRLVKSISFSSSSAGKVEQTKNFYAFFEVPEAGGEFTESLSADLNGDGNSENVILTFLKDKSVSLEVSDGRKSVWKKQLGLYHSDQKAYYLCTDTDKNETYILEYCPYMNKGIANYSYKLYSYNGKKVQKVEGDSVSFDISGKEHLPVEELAGFYIKINSLIKKSACIVSTLGGVPSAQWQICSDFNWLEEAQGIYTSEESFSELLQKYDDWAYNNYHSSTP